MMRTWKRITSILCILMVTLLFGLVIYMKVDPEGSTSIFPYRLYVVKSDSMEPVIPTYSLVISQHVSSLDALDEDTIITFKAERFGNPILLTHYLKKIETTPQETYYRTQGAEAPNLDAYDTTKDDIVGTYVMHIPYLGKLILFLQSKYGCLYAGELLIIWLIHQTIVTKWLEARRVISIDCLDMQEENGYLIARGILTHHFKKPIRFVSATLCLYDKDHRMLKEDAWYLVEDAYLPPEQPQEFTYYSEFGNEVAHIDIYIQRYKI